MIDYEDIKEGIAVYILFVIAVIVGVATFIFILISAVILLHYAGKFLNYMEIMEVFR